MPSLRMSSLMSLLALKTFRPGVFHDVGREFAFVVHGRVDIEAVGHSRQVILLAVAGRGMDAARPVVESHVVGQDEKRIAVDPGMAGFQPFEVLARDRRQDLRTRPIRTSRRGPGRAAWRRYKPRSPASKAAYSYSG